MSVPSDNTPFEHLVLTMTPTDYLLKTTELFDLPCNPGTGPTIAHGATALTITQAHWLFQVEKKLNDVYHVTDKVLKLQLRSAVEEVPYNDLHDNDVRYALVSTRLLLDHLWTSYGKIDDNQLAANTGCMSARWSPPTPIDNLFEQLKFCMKFARERGDPITSTAATCTGAFIIEENGLFPITNKDWRANAATQ